MHSGQPQHNTVTSMKQEKLERAVPHDALERTGHDHSHVAKGDSAIATVAWMIIFGDGLHNFVDGLSIGAAFQTSTLTGISVSVAVFCEECPHELGDFAILLNSGMTLKQAIISNVLSASTCYLGLVVGIVVGDIPGVTVYIFGFAGGMFLYISLAAMMPEMAELLDKALAEGKGMRMLLLQNLGLLVGVVLMFVLAMFQGNIQFV
ncbi:PREDICTED: zinc transporter ZIP14-like [Priapulus caudatus]|uniref:Zinc transporter ZIP14-like n=1 Tax=Priapulus caudatus TaxID=37621 RepID=A0ABM1EHA5_PRICU|nr:PREDICTED: zinc transporter ZIP14-like [Priapulus caudatus]